MSSFDEAMAQLDAANAEDPNVITVDGVSRPAALVYAERMSATLLHFTPGASEALQLAARAQHLRRWTVPRASYPDGRVGYLRWRADLKQKHAEWAAEILRTAGYDEAFCDRVGALIRKEGLKSCAEAQTLEDVACLVFLEHYANAFFAEHDDFKTIGILKKTWAKMSAAGRERAQCLSLSPRVQDLLKQALAKVPTSKEGSS